MSLATPDCADMLKRLERLERQRVALLFISVLALAVAASCLYLFRPGAMVTEQIVFRDASGRPRASMGWDEAGDSLGFFDAAGKKMATLASGRPSDGAVLRVFDGQSRARVAVMGDSVGGGAVSLIDEGEMPLLALTVSNNQPFIELRSAGGRPRIRIAVRPDQRQANDLPLMLWTRSGPSIVIATEDGTAVFSKP